MADNDADKAAAKAKEEAAVAEQKMLAGEVPLDNPGSVDWPDSVPVQSRYGNPEDMVTPQSLQSAQEATEVETKAAGETQPKGESAPTKTAPGEQPAKSEPSAGK